MDKMERFEELKGNILKKIQYNEPVPEEVKKIIEKTLNNLLEVYYDEKCGNQSIERYIEGAKGELFAQLDHIGNDRKNSQFEEFSSVINSIRNNLENEEENRKNKDEIRIESVNFNDNKHTNRTIDIVTDTLKDIQNHQNRILSSLGYSYDTDELNYIVNGFIRNFEMKQGEEIEYLYKEDKDRLVKEVIEEYEEFVISEELENKAKEENVENEKNQSIQENPDNKREQFIEALDAGKSLEEQKQYVEEIKEKDEKQENEYKYEQLPDNILE